MMLKLNVKLKALAMVAPYMGLLGKKTTNEFLFCWTIQLLSANIVESQLH